MMSVALLPFFQHVNWKPDRSELRRFAWAMLCGFAVIGLIVAWRVGGFGNKTFALWGVGIVLAALALIPKLGRLTYLCVYLPTSVIGYFVSHIVLTFIFFLVVVPLSFLLRLMKKDLLRLKPRERRAVWFEVKKTRKADDYYRQF